MHSPVHLLKAILEVSWQSSLVIALILLIRPLFGTSVSARWRYLLWTLVLFRLLVPVSLLPSNPASLQNIPVVNHPLEQASLALDRFSATPPPEYYRPDSQRAEVEALSYVPTVSPTTRNSHFSWWQAATVVWLCGMAAFGLWILLATLGLRRRLNRDSVEVEESVREIWERCCRSLVIRRPPRLLANPRVESPALVGLFRPVLLIPANVSLSTEDWEHIFMHELAHCRRFDDWTQSIQLLALCVHWFNPLVWFGFRCLRADRELAADEWALQQLRGHRPVAYADTLLKILISQSRLEAPPCAIGIMEDRVHLKHRLERIVAFGPRKLAGSIAGVLVLLVLAVVVLGKPADRANLSAFDGLTPAEILVVAARNGDQPTLQKVLDQGVDINSTPGNRTALAAAAAANEMEIVRLLLVKGADVNLKPDSGDAPVVAAFKQGRTDCAEYLLGKGAICDADILAAAKGDTAAIQGLLASGKADATKLKSLADVAGACGHADTYIALAEGIGKLSGQARWRASDSAPLVPIARGHRDVVEAMIKYGSGLNKVHWVRPSASAAQTPGMREWLASKGFKVAEYSDGERLIDAVEREDLAEIRRLVKAGVDVNYRGLGTDDWTPLTRAAEGGRAKAVKLLLELGANPNIVHSPGWNFSPLCLARTTAIADMLLAAGADLNAKLFKRDVHIIDHCVLYGPVEMVQWFIDHGVDPTKIKGDEPTLLFTTTKPEVAEILLNHGVDVNAKDQSGFPAIYRIEQMAANPAKTVAVLLKHGADPNMRVADGHTPLMSAPDGETVDVLVAAGADINARNDRGASIAAQYTPNADPSRIAALVRHGLKLDVNDQAALLTRAIERHRIGEVQSLLQQGVDPNIGEKDIYGGGRFSPLSTALSWGEFEIAAMLRQAGAKDVSMLAQAAAQGDLAQMKSLVEAGADVNDTPGHGGPPINFAIHRGQVQAVQFLLDHGADINLFDSIGMTPYGMAKMLDWNIRETSEWSPIRGVNGKDARAATNAILALLRARKPDPNYQNKEGETALFAAATAGNDSVLGALAEFHLNINSQRADGMTPLMVAIVHQPRDASRTGPGSAMMTNPKTGVEEHYSSYGIFIKNLLDSGADLTLRNKAGQTALDLARESGNEEILSLLQQPVKRPQ